MTIPGVRMRKYLEEGRIGVEGELDSAGLLLLLRTESWGEGGGQEYRAQSGPWLPGPGFAEGAELGREKVKKWSIAFLEEPLFCVLITEQIW